MKFWKRFLSLSFALAIGGVLLAPGTANAKVGEANKITCMYPVWVGFGPVHLANELGYFKEEGIDGRGDPRRRHAQRHRRHGARRHRLLPAHGRRVSRASVGARRRKGIIIGTIDLSTGGDGWAADQSIKSVCDLKGKTIAVEPNLPARLIMQMALKKECNLSIKDTNLSDIAAADAIGVFSDPNVAAVGTYEPVLSQVVAAHQERGAHIVASSKDYEDLILDIIIAHKGELKAHPDKYVKFLRAIYRGGRLLQRQPGQGDPDHRQAVLDHAGRLQGDPAELPLHALRRGDRADRHARQGRARLRGLPRGDGPQSRVRLRRPKLVPEDHIDRSVINQVEKY